MEVVEEVDYEGLPPNAGLAVSRSVALCFKAALTAHNY